MLATRSRRALSSAGLILAAFAFAGGLAACSSSPEEDTTDQLASGDFESDFADWRIKFDDCMKDEGIELPPMASTSQGSGDGEVLTLPDAGSIDFEAMQKASKTCIAKVGEAPVDPSAPTQQEMNEMMLAFAKCMREAGYDYPDPVISEDGGVSAIPGVPMSDGPEAEAAQQCSATAGYGDSSSTGFSGTNG